MRKSLVKAQKLIDKVMSEGGSVLDPYKLKWDEIELGKALGEGSFGTVYEGMLRGKEEVAIKTMRTTAINEGNIRSFQVL